MDGILKGFLVTTALFFWADHLLNRWPPPCKDGFVGIGVPHEYLCVFGHTLHEDRKP